MTITSVRGLEMLSYLPPYYAESRVMNAILQAIGTESDSLNLALNEALDQFYVNTATWGLDIWETELALVADPNLSTAQRRQRIIDLLSGAATPTLARVKALVESFTVV